MNDRFNLHDIEYRSLLPKLIGDIVGRVDEFVRCLLAPHVSRFGLIPYYALRNSDHDHDATVFDLFIGTYQDTVKDHHLLELERTVHRFSEGPWDERGTADERRLALNKMMPIASCLTTVNGVSAASLAEEWLNRQICYLADYLAHVRLAEHGSVLEKLHSVGADYRIEPGRNYVRIAVPDAGIAAAIEREFW